MDLHCRVDPICDEVAGLSGVRLWVRIARPQEYRWRDTVSNGGGAPLETPILVVQRFCIDG